MKSQTINTIMITACGQPCSFQRDTWRETAQGILDQHDHQLAYIKAGIPSQPYTKVFTSSEPYLSLEEHSIRDLREALADGTIDARDAELAAERETDLAKMIADAKDRSEAKS